MRNKRWFVVTPPVMWQDIVFDGQGPWYEDPDVIEIEAETAKDAVAMGVKLMLKSRDYSYCRDQRSDGCSPYTGVKAECTMDCDCWEVHADLDLTEASCGCDCHK
mgnify:CR=1 FL=1